MCEYASVCACVFGKERNGAHESTHTLAGERGRNRQKEEGREWGRESESEGESESE